MPYGIGQMAGQFNTMPIGGQQPPQQFQLPPQQPPMPPQGGAPMPPPQQPPIAPPAQPGMPPQARYGMLAPQGGVPQRMPMGMPNPMMAQRLQAMMLRRR